MTSMYKFKSFLKRLIFLEVHPAILTGIVSVPIAAAAINSYIMMGIYTLPEDLRETILQYEREDEEHNKAVAKKLEYYRQVMRPNLYGYREPPHIKQSVVSEKEFMA